MGGVIRTNSHGCPPVPMAAAFPTPPTFLTKKKNGLIVHAALCVLVCVVLPDRGLRMTLH